ncbi:MAG: hypothetical protein JXA03_11130 [Bacteroidales bacterium]|nr:hypothetical protein [Bacteroidales bacterium]
MSFNSNIFSFGYFSRIIVIFLASLSMSGCIEDELPFDKIKSQNWESQWAIPLLDTRVQLDDLVNDSLTMIEEGADGLISFVYETDNLITLNAAQVVTIPDQSFNVSQDYLLPPLQAGEEGIVPLSLPLEFTTDTAGQRIDSLYLKKGNFYLKVISNLNRNNVRAEITLPSLIRREGRDTLKFTSDVSNPSGSSLVTRDTTISLEGFIMIFNKDVFTQNRITLKAVIRYIEDGNPDQSPYSLVLENSFSDLEYASAFGYLGGYMYLMKDTLVLEALKLNEDNEFTFASGSVTLDLTTHNSIGAPLQLTINDFYAFHENSGNTLQVELGTTVFDLDYPAYSEVGQYAVSYFNSVESNLNEVLNDSYSRFFIETEVLMNPENDSTVLNFVLDSSRVKTNIEVALKLFGSLSSFMIADTVGFDAGVVDDLSSVSFSVLTENLFPVFGDIRVSFLDSLDYSLFDLIPEGENLLTAAAMSGPPSYRAVSPSVKEMQIPVQAENLELMRQARKIALSVTLSTPEGQVVKIYSDYYVRFRMGVLAGVEY